jgi:hypothetical protein
MKRSRRCSPALVLAVPFVAAALLAACGSSTGTGANASAAATATPTCPPASATGFKTVTGSITALVSGGFTVMPTTGTATTVQISSTAVITRIAIATPADLTAGTAVQVITDTNATMARSIRILGSGATGTGGFGGFGNRGSGTPAAGFNAACRRRGTGSGQGAGTDSGAGFGNGFQGLRGTIDSATSSKLVFDDTQGQTYSVAITSSTAIDKISTATAADLKVGMKVLVAGTASGSRIAARSVTIEPSA